MVYEIDEDISRSISSSIIYLLKSGAKREYYYLFDKAIYQKGSTASGIDPIYYTALSLAHYYDDYLLLDYLIETKSIDLTRQIWMDDALKPINSLQLMFDENVMQRYYTRTFSRNPMIYEKLLSYATAIGIDVTKTKLKLGIKYYIYKDDISMFKEAIVGFDDLDAFARDFAEYFESSKILDFLTNLGY